MTRRSVVVATLIWLLVAFTSAGIVHLLVADAQLEHQITSVALFPLLVITSAMTDVANALLLAARRIGVASGITGCLDFECTTSRRGDDLRGFRRIDHRRARPGIEALQA